MIYSSTILRTLTTYFLFEEEEIKDGGGGDLAKVFNTPLFLLPFPYMALPEVMIFVIHGITPNPTRPRYWSFEYTPYYK